MHLKNRANLWMLAAFITFLSCNNADQHKYPSVPGYHINDPYTIHLKAALDEISGIYYYPKDTSVFAVNDEQGILFKIYLREQVMIKTWKFSNGADYEDLVLLDNTFFALHSNGAISKFRFQNGDSTIVEECEIPLKGKNEFEAVYVDNDRKKLVLICKDCKGEKENSPAYTFDPNTKAFGTEPLYSIAGKDIVQQLDGDESMFKSSAAAIHPITKELYIVSSVNKALVVADTLGKVKKVYALDPKTFKQPEGITFSPGGDMLISNEAADVGAGQILIFKYKPQRS